VWRTVAPDGRIVVLTTERWAHIVDRHDEAERHRALILDVVARPDLWHVVGSMNEEWFFRERAGPSVWLQVVVHFAEDRGIITTAFARRSLPKWL